MISKKHQGLIAHTTGELGLERARRLFLQWTWLPRIYGMDQGIDLMVEVADRGRGTGHVFAVQCKASGNSSQVKRDGVSVLLDGRVISYLLSQRFPVYLLFCPLDTEAVYWVDIRRALKGASRKKDGGALVKIPLKNRFDVSDTSRHREMRDTFLASIGESGEELDSVSMKQIADTLRARELHLESLDPRCRVKVHASSRGQEITLAAKEEFTIAASLKPASIEDALLLKEAIEFGIDAEIRMREAKFSGSPIFEEVANAGQPGTISVRSDSKVNYVVRLSAPGDVRSKVKSLRFGGMMSKGSRGASLRAGAQDHPVTIELRIISDERTIQATIHTGFETMLGLRVVTQEKLASAAEVLAQVSAADRLDLELVSSDIDTVISAPMSDDMSRVLRYGAMRLSNLNDLKYICEMFNPEFQILAPHATNDKEAEWWTIGRRICEGELVEIVADKLTFSGEFSRDLRELQRSDGRMLDFVVVGYPLNLRAFGAPLCTLPVDIFLGEFEGRIEHNGESQSLTLIRSAESQINLALSGSKSYGDLAIFESFDGAV